MLIKIGKAQLANTDLRHSWCRLGEQQHTSQLQGYWQDVSMPDTNGGYPAGIKFTKASAASV